MMSQTQDDTFWIIVENLFKNNRLNGLHFTDTGRCFVQSALSLLLVLSCAGVTAPPVGTRCFLHLQHQRCDTRLQTNNHKLQVKTQAHLGSFLGYKRFGRNHMTLFKYFCVLIRVTRRPGFELLVPCPCGFLLATLTCPSFTQILSVVSQLLTKVNPRGTNTA